jgi:hypothetical protein
MTPTPGAAGRSLGPPRSGFARSTPRSGLSIPTSGRPPSSGWCSWSRPTGSGPGVPQPSGPGERRAEISGRAKADSFLRDQEAVCL